MRFLDFKGQPTPDFLIATMRTFARAGLDRFNEQRVQSRISHTALGPLIPGFVGSQTAEVEPDISIANLQRSESKFWALPEISGDKSFISFFRVRRLDIKGQHFPDVDVELLLLWYQRADSAGFRFERGFRGNSDRHFYPHMQLTEKFRSSLAGEVTTGTPVYLAKCPAFPLPAMIQYTNWFSCLLALAGHQKDEAKGLINVFDGLSGYHHDGDHSAALVALKRTVFTLVKRERSFLESACNIASTHRWLLGRP